MNKMRPLVAAVIQLLLVTLWSDSSVTQRQRGRLQTRAVTQCYGKQFTAKCPTSHVIRVISATYGQSRECTIGGSSIPADAGQISSIVSSVDETDYEQVVAEKNPAFGRSSPEILPAATVDCSREESGNPACVGSQNCTFMTPWVYISSDCGYSNQFRILYQCVPNRLVVPICTVPSLTGATYGFISSPGYPHRYSGSQNCSVTVVAPSTGHIRVYVIDMYLASYRGSNSDQWRCIDRVFVSDGFEQTKYMCTADKRDLVFTSSSNQATVYFSSTGRDSIPAKGFWLYYEVVESSGSIPSTSSSSSVSIRQVARPTTGKLAGATMAVQTGNGSRNGVGLGEQLLYPVAVNIPENRTTTSSQPSSTHGSTPSSMTSSTTTVAAVVVPSNVDTQSSTYADGGPRKNSTNVHVPSEDPQLSKQGNEIINQRPSPPMASTMTSSTAAPTLIVGIRDVRVKLDITEDAETIDDGGTATNLTTSMIAGSDGVPSKTDKAGYGAVSRSSESTPAVDFETQPRWNPSKIHSVHTWNNTTSSSSSSNLSSPSPATVVAAVTVVGPVNASSQRQSASLSNGAPSLASTPESLASAVNGQNTEYYNVDFGIPEIGAVTGGSACLVLLLFVAPLAAYFHLRKRRFLRTKRFLARNNSYKNVIMAFGSDDDVTNVSATPEMRYGATDSSSGSISPSSSSVMSTSDDASAAVGHVHGWAQPGNASRHAAGNVGGSGGTVWMTNGSTSGCGPGAVTVAAMQHNSGPASAAAGRWLMMMPPIDERLEDVYAAFKRQCDGTKKRGVKGENAEGDGDPKMPTGGTKIKSRRSKSVDHLLMRRRAVAAASGTDAPGSPGSPVLVADSAHNAMQTGWGWTSSANTGQQPQQQQQPAQHQHHQQQQKQQQLCDAAAKRMNPTSYERLQNAGRHGDGSHLSEWPHASPSQLPGKLGRAVSTNTGVGGARIGYFTPGRVQPPTSSVHLSLPRGRHQMCGILVDTPYEANLLENEEEDVAL